MDKEKRKTNAVLSDPFFKQFIEPHIDYLFRQRETAGKQDIEHINMAIILFSVIFFEGFLKYLLCILEYENNHFDDLEKLQKIEKISSWEKYKKEFIKYNINFDKILTKKEINNIKNIFLMRHFIAHGSNNIITMQIDQSGITSNIRETYLDEIEKFFLANKLVAKKEFIGANFDAIFSDNVANWFYKEIKDYYKNILNWFNQEFKDNKIITTKLNF